jgi:hypothetical protein
MSPGFTRGLPWEACFIASCPHKALHRSALWEKHPVLRVGGAEGAPESRSVIPLQFFNLPFSSLLFSKKLGRDVTDEQHSRRSIFNATLRRHHHYMRDGTPESVKLI